MSNGTVIVGACQAGFQIAATLREKGYGERIRLIGEESYLPYQRPPLSKAFMTSDPPIDQLMLRAAGFYEQNRIECVTSERITEVDMRGRRVVSATGRSFAFDHLALTTGCAARKLPLPGGDLPGVMTLRDIPDALEMKRRLHAAENVVVIGGGFIGLESAAVAAKLGKKAIVLEAMDRLLARVVAPPMSEFYAAVHARRGMKVMLKARIEKLEGDAAGVRGVRLADGTLLPADLVVVGIGGASRTELAEQVGIECANGIMVDDHALTSIAGVVAAGDCATHRDLYGRPTRLESVQNAIDQGKIAASSILGLDERYNAIPWFWSDQADLKLQITGLSTGYDNYVVRGVPDSESFSVLYYAGDRLIAVDSVGKPADHLASRRLLGSGVAVPKDMAANVDVPLKSLLG